MKDDHISLVAGEPVQLSSSKRWTWHRIGCALFHWGEWVAESYGYRCKACDESWATIESPLAALLSPLGLALVPCLDGLPGGRVIIGSVA